MAQQAQRTIQSPGVQIFENDLSLKTPEGGTVGGTNIYVTGFAQQGPTDEVLRITSPQEQIQVFGTPTNPAERYFFYTIKELLNSPANIYAARLPYGANKGDGYGSMYTALAYPVTAVGSEARDYNTLNFTESGVYVLGAPVHCELTESQYLSALAGTLFDWSNTGSTTRSIINLGNSAAAGTLSGLGKAGAIVLNKSQSTIDGSFQGFYCGLEDNTNLNPAANFTSIKNIYSVNKNDGSVTGVLSAGDFIKIPTNTLQFGVTSNYLEGPNISISDVMENLTDYEINGADSRDILSLGVFKLRKSIFADEAFKLDYMLTDSGTGSINYARTINNPRGGPALSYFLPNKTETSRDVHLLINDNVSSRLSGGDGLDNNGNPTKWIRVYNSGLGTLMETAAGRVEAGFNNSDYVKLSSAMGSPAFVGTRVSGTAGIAASASLVGPDLGNLFGLGAYSNPQTNKLLGSVPDKIERALDLVKNDEIYDLDVVVEGGLGTIYATSQAASTTYYDDANTSSALMTALQGLRTPNAITGGSLTLRNNYNLIFDKFNNFCKPPYLAGGSRGDCIFIADIIRQLLVTGANTKILANAELNFQKDLLWPIRHQFETQNTSYATVYGQWMQIYDTYYGKACWVPFSGYAGAAMARTDAVAHPWFAPAGFTRGLVTGGDIAVNPNQKQRDELYKANINPVAFFPGQGQVIFGQKTLSKKPSAFDRINVRRLFLALERPTRKASRMFVFEQNNTFTRTRLLNTLTPLFENAKNTDGLYDYLIVCDERNNPTSTVDAHELRVDIYIKPVRTAEFILVTFYATRTDANFEEIVAAQYG